MPNRLCKALLHVMPTELGGRQTPFFGDYRPIFFAAGASLGTSFLLQKIENAEQMKPGESGVVHGLLLHPEEVGVPVGKGTEFELREGHKVVATGIIQEYS